MAALAAACYAVLVNILILSIVEGNNNSFSSNTTMLPDQNDTSDFTNVYSSTQPTQFESTTQISNSTSSISTKPPEPELPDDPLPESGRLLQPPTGVAEVCPCDQNRGLCDMNCCCDAECGPEVALFTGCSVHTVRGSEKLCNRDVASYALSTTIDGYSELKTSVHNEKNYDTFCIYSHNRVNGLSHPPPALPTDRNFDSLFDKFSGFTFSSERSQASAPEPQPSSGYQFGDMVRTKVGSDHRDVLYVPSSGITMDCVDTNPAAFLQKQSGRCSRRVDLQQDCERVPALSMDTYTDLQLFSDKSTNAVLVPVEVSSIVLQSLEGTQTEVPLDEEESLPPVLVSPGVCAHVVLEVAYSVKYNPSGEIVSAAASVVLGFVQDTSVPFEQSFEIMFYQEDGPEVVVQFSGNPGYVIGLPLVSGYKTTEGLSRSLNPRDSLSLLQSSVQQDCLQGPQLRSPVLFGQDSVTGCTLRLSDMTNCTLMSQVVLDILRGSNYPQYVASFGNSPLEKLLDWVAIKRTFNPQDSPSCGIPLLLHLEIEWTRYGTLVNPQAQIVSVKEIIQTNSSQLALLSGGSGVLSIQTSVAFISVSAPAAPGYRAMPTIDAKLPFDFFFPFV